MRFITVIDRQNLIDIALQETGSIESAIDLLLDDASINYPVSDVLNPIIDDNLQYGFMSPLAPGSQILIKQPLWNQDIYNYYKENGIRSVTGYQYIFLNSTYLPDFNILDFNNEDFKTN